MFELSSNFALLITFCLVCLWHFIEGLIFLLKKDFRKTQVVKRTLFKYPISKIVFSKILYYGNNVRILSCLIGLIFAFFFKEIPIVLIYFILIYQIIHNIMLRAIVETSDRMVILVVLGIVLSLTFEIRLGLFFIAGNAILAYFFTGYKKIIAPLWRNGEALFMVMNTETFGNKYIAQFLMRNKSICLILSWSIILIQLTFPFAVVNEYLLVSYLVVGFLFHLSVMLIMKLHSFFFSFLSTYPSLVYITIQLQMI